MGGSDRFGIAADEPGRAGVAGPAHDHVPPGAS
jgi:hypothetical protein